MWTPAPRSAEAQGLYDAAEADLVINPDRYRLDVDSVTAAAFAEKPLPGDDNGDWREGLAVYLAAAQAEGGLNALGRRSMAGTAVGRLSARRSIANALARDPSVRERVIDRPIIVIGGWRTGTTLLQRLLASVPALRAVYPAELTTPWRFAGMDEDARLETRQAGEKAHKRLHVLNPAMAAIHPSGALMAEECVLAMGTDFHNWGFTSTLRSPSYAAWLAGQDFEGPYRRYADILRLLQDDSGRRWILKAPAHTAELASLLKVFPDACIVHLHRDVVQTVTSGASLFAVFRSTYSDQVDPADVGAYQLETTAAWFDRAIAAREANPGARVIDLAFPELAADPLATARKLCQAFEVTWDEATQSAAAARLAELNNQHGAHRYSPQDFGLDPDRITERLSAYRSRFGL